MLIPLLSLDGGEGLNHQLGEAGQRSGAAGQDFALGEEDEHVAHGVIDGRAGLEVADGAECVAPTIRRTYD